MFVFSYTRLSLPLVLLALTCLVLQGRTEPAKVGKQPSKSVGKVPVKATSKPKIEPKIKESEAVSPAADYDKDPDEDQYKFEEKDPTGDHYTSVIIDASDFHVMRSMSPKICATTGTKVWPNLAYIDPEYVLSWGIVVYVHSLEDAKSHKRAGKNPLVLRAIGQGPTSDDAVISDADVAILQSANKRNQCVDKFRVIFLLDKKNAEKKPSENKP